MLNFNEDEIKDLKEVEALATSEPWQLCDGHEDNLSKIVCHKDGNEHFGLTIPSLESDGIFMVQSRNTFLKLLEDWKFMKASLKDIYRHCKFPYSGESAIHYIKEVSKRFIDEQMTFKGKRCKPNDHFKNLCDIHHCNATFLVREQDGRTILVASMCLHGGIIKYEDYDDNLRAMA